MADKPKRASEYKSEQVELVRATCLYVATKLGDMMDDLLIIGGLVPSLIVDQTTLPEGAGAHVGTMDLDVGLQLVLLGEGRYRKLTERLRDAGFEMDKNEDGNPTRQRWAITNSVTVTVDFLIPPSLDGDRGGKLRDIEPDFAAIIAPGLLCAFPIGSVSPWRGEHTSARRPPATYGSATPARMSCSKRWLSTAAARTKTPTTSST